MYIPASSRNGVAEDTANRLQGWELFILPHVQGLMGVFGASTCTQVEHDIIYS